MLKHVRYFF